MSKASVSIMSMFDLDAAIIPGESAAGVCVGQTIADILVDEKPNAIVCLRAAIKYDFGIVHLWVTDGSISQIGLFSGYRGLMQSGIKIGSTIGEIQRAIGPVVEDDEDNLVVPGSLGWCFETEEWLEGHQPEQNPNAQVSEIYVFRPAV